MKAMIFNLFIIVGLFLVGCSNDSSLIGPSGTDITSQSLQTQGDSFINLPVSSLRKGDKSKEAEKEKEVEKEIDGEKGGKIKIKGELDGLKYKAELKIPKGAFVGKKKITIKFNDTKAAFDFGPDNTVFDKPLEFSAKVEGVYLEGINSNDIHFVQLLSNGTLVGVVYDKLKVDVKKGKLEVKKAQINHFSRYGWAK